ncbi:MAG TPA: BamA/TamA family outer membrane protein [Kofleriaceae bacterium]|nr:BamA/TamA family outer membrane protein [Kofleriaceae bacterium]
MQRPGVTVATALAIAACGTAAPVHRPGEVYIATIAITGNHAIKSGALVAGLGLHRRQLGGRALDEYQLSVDEQRIAGAYEKLGYFDVAVHASVTHDGLAEHVVFAVTEGPRATMRVEIDGLPPEVPLAKIRALVKVADGAPFDYDAYDDAKSEIERALEDAGYAHVQLDAGVIADRAQHLAIARYVIDPGTRCTFGAIAINGVTGALRSAAAARVTIKPGTPYTAEAIADTQRALYALDRFSTVRVDVPRNSTDTVLPVTITLSEANAHEIRAGGGFGVDPINYSVRLRAQYTQVGWPFPLSSISIDLRPAYTLLRSTCDWYKPLDCQREPRLRLLGTFTEQDFLIPKLTAQLETGADFLTIEAYTIESLFHTRLGLAMPIVSSRLQARVGWLLGWYTFADPSSLLDATIQHELGIDHIERLGEYTQALTLDLRDDPLDTHYGAYAELRIAEGTPYAGGAYRFVQLTPEARGYLPIGPLVLAARLRVGKIYGDVPPTERYYAGGASSDRGFPERQLSPVVTDATTGAQVVIGGASLVETGAELRVPVGKLYGQPAGVVAFVDGGDVRDTDAVDWTELHWAVGLGFRWSVLPVGPFRLDFAYRVGHDAVDEPKLGRFEWFVSVGETY